MSWYNTGEPRQDWASSWRHFRTLRETQDYKIIHLVFKHKNDSSDSKWVPSVCRSVGYLLSLSSERPRGLWMEMSGEDDGYWADKTAETRLRFKSDDGHFCYHCEQIHEKTKTNSERVSACTHTESLQEAIVETLPADRGSKSGWVGRTGRRSPRLWTGTRPGSPPSPWGHNMNVSSDIKKTASQTPTAAPRRHSAPNSIYKYVDLTSICSRAKDDSTEKIFRNFISQKDLSKLSEWNITITLFHNKMTLIVIYDELSKVSSWQKANRHCLWIWWRPH